MLTVYARGRSAPPRYFVRSTKYHPLGNLALYYQHFPGGLRGRSAPPCVNGQHKIYWDKINF